MTLMTLLRRHLLATCLAMAVVGGVATGVVWALLGSAEGPQPAAPVGNAEAVYAPDGRLLGAPSGYDESVEFPPSLSALPNPPTHLSVDPATGHLWFPIFTYDGVANILHHFDPASGSTEEFEVPASDGSEMLSAIAIDDRGRVVFAEGHSVNIFDPELQTLEQLELPAQSQHRIEDGDGDPAWITAMALDGGLAYISRMNVAAIIQLDLETGETAELPIPASFGQVWDLALSNNRLVMSSRWDIEGGPSAQTAYLHVTSGTFTDLRAKTSAVASNSTGTTFVAGWPPVGLAEMVGDTLASAKERVADGSSLLSVEDGLGALGHVAVSEAGDVWVVGEGSDAIVHYLPQRGEAVSHRLPEYSAEGLSAIVRGCWYGCEDVARSTTRVRGLAVAPNGDLYFSDATMNRIGVIHVD